MYDILFYLTYALIFLAALGLVIGIVVAIIQNFKDGGLAAIIGLVGILVLFGIGYALSSTEIPQSIANKSISGLDGIRKVSGGLIAFYGLAIIASILVVVDIAKGIIEGL